MEEMKKFLFSIIAFLVIPFGFWVGGSFDGVKSSFIAGSTPELEAVEKEFKNIDSKEDKQFIHMLFCGASEYLKRTEAVHQTQQFDPILGRVQSAYGWEREKYEDFTDAVSDYLDAVDYDTPKKLETRSQREDFAKIFSDLAEATKYE